MKKTTKIAVTVAAMSVMVLGTAVMASADGKQGWVQEGSNWYYYNTKGDKLVNAWAQDGSGIWYFLGDDGAMVKDKFINNDELLVVEDSEDLNNDAKFFYVGKDGAMVKGWYKAYTDGNDRPTADDKWYFFGADGQMYQDAWVQAGSDWYYVNEDGTMREKDTVKDDEVFYLKKGGLMVKGWYKMTSDDEDKIPDIYKDEWIYANDKGELFRDGWKKVNSTWYYFGEADSYQQPDATSGSGTGIGTDYQMVKETFIKDDGNFFYLKSNGAMATGWIKIDADDDGTKEYYYSGSNGKIKINTVESISGKYYYFDNNGVMDEDNYAYKYSYRNDKNQLKYAYVLLTGDYSSMTKALEAAEADFDTLGLGSDAKLVTVYKLGSGSYKNK